MTSLTTGTTTVGTTVNTFTSPRRNSAQDRPSQGIANSGSCISSADTDENGITQFEITGVRNSSNSTDNPPLINSSTVNNSIKPKGSPDDDPIPSSGGRSNSGVTIPIMISTFFQRFLVRMPHTFIAMTAVFVPLYYVLDKESLAISATTFVGVGGTVYCFVRAFFLEVIPEWMLAHNNDTRKWRHLINLTYTGFITVMFTTAVWKLPDLSAAQGFTFLVASFGVPYPFLAKLYPDIDKKPTWFGLHFGT